MSATVAAAMMLYEGVLGADSDRANSPSSDYALTQFTYAVAGGRSLSSLRFVLVQSGASD